MISTIIPVYNVEQWLDRCVQSVVNQTYKDIEILLIDDGSTDKSSEMCDKWVEEDSRISVYHKSNEGLGPTRNFGLKKASGEYIAFIDSDDSIDECYIESLYNAISSCNADFVSSDFKEYDCITGEITYCHMDIDEGIYSTSKEKNLMLNRIFPMLWAKLFRRDFLMNNNIMQPPIKHEDEAVRPIYVLTANKIMHIKNAMYNYTVNRNGSIMKNGQDYNDICKAIEYYLEYFKLHNLWDNYYEVLKTYTSFFTLRYSKKCDKSVVDFSALYRKYFATEINMDKPFIIFGAGKIGKEMFEHIPNGKIAYVADNNPDLCGTTLNDKEIISFEKLKEIHNGYTIVLAISKRKPLFDVIGSFKQNNINNYVCFTEIVLNK